jgi:bifunctional DNA-binding transcriptional regulator/antitoxin component of YhaV-PrlF toxin-antitoxin module
LPKNLVEELGWKSGSFLEIAVEGESVSVRRIEVDPFAEAAKKPDEGAFDRILQEQKKSRDAAFRAFDEKTLPEEGGKEDPTDR